MDGQNDRDVSFGNDVEVTVMTEWQGRTSQKVPSLLSYSQSPKHRDQCGHDIDELSHVIQWFKLDLDPQKAEVQLRQLDNAIKGLKLVEALYCTDKEVIDTDIPFHIAKDSTEVVRNFIEKLIAAWKKNIEESFQRALGNVPVDVVVTHPAVSSFKDLTLK